MDTTVVSETQIVDGESDLPTRDFGLVENDPKALPWTEMLKEPVVAALSSKLDCTGTSYEDADVHDEIACSPPPVKTKALREAPVPRAVRQRIADVPSHRVSSHDDPMRDRPE